VLRRSQDIGHGSPITLSSSPIVEHCLRKRFANFNLGAHLLDLRCLFFHGRNERFNLFRLLRNLRSEILL
jgi:hypothetical protein